MSITTTLSLPADALTSGSDAVPTGVKLEFEPFIPVGGGSQALLRATGTDVDHVRSMLDSLDPVESYEELNSEPGNHLFRVCWHDTIDGILGCVDRADATLLTAVATGSTWQLRLQFSEQGDVSRFQSYCRELDIPFTVLRLDRTGTSGSSSSLQPKQRQALELALEKGYFDVPRGTTLQDLADDLGISDQSVSERLRRGLSSVLEDNLTEQ
jgi:predicted DNA binding protein